MTLRLHVDLPLCSGSELSLPDGAARHAQVRRVQPGDAVQIFDGHGREWAAFVTVMGRSAVRVRIGDALPNHTESAVRVTLAFGLAANERTDFLIEKATELGVHALHPLQCERAVVRLDAERAGRKRAHWQAVAVAASEQCGRASVPAVEPVRSLAAWLALPAAPGARLLLSLAHGAPPLHALPAQETAVLALSGPEGGLAPAEEDAARAAGFAPVSLGPRVLRADTAPLALLAFIALRG